jgi:hypothetical protein
VGFLVGEGWLAHYLDFPGERMLPPVPKLVDALSWLDSSDPHRMAAAMQVAARPMQDDYVVVTGDWRYDLIGEERVWPKAVHRVVTEGIGPKRSIRRSPDQVDPERVADRHPTPFPAAGAAPPSRRPAARPGAGARDGGGRITRRGRRGASASWRRPS